MKITVQTFMCLECEYTYEVAFKEGIPTENGKIYIVKGNGIECKKCAEPMYELGAIQRAAISARISITEQKRIKRENRMKPWERLAYARGFNAAYACNLETWSRPETHVKALESAAIEQARTKADVP